MLPELDSTMTVSFVIRPDLMPCSRMLIAVRSLMLPPGFSISIFAYSLKSMSLKTCLSLTNGVLPIADNTPSLAVSTALRTCMVLSPIMFEGWFLVRRNCSPASLHTRALGDLVTNVYGLFREELLETQMSDCYCCSLLSDVA